MEYFYSVVNHITTYLLIFNDSHPFLSQQYASHDRHPTYMQKHAEKYPGNVEQFPRNHQWRQNISREELSISFVLFFFHSFGFFF